MLSVYLLVPASNRFAEKIPLSWQHVAVWGGLRGALALALALSLNSTFPYREQILNLTFGVVIFSILAQGLTMKLLLRILRIGPDVVEPVEARGVSGKVTGSDSSPRRTSPFFQRMSVVALASCKSGKRRSRALIAIFASRRARGAPTQ